MLCTNIADRSSARIPVSVDSDASGDEIVGWHDGTLAIRVAAGLAHREADSAVETLLADVLGVAPSQVSVILGRSDALKLVEVDGIGDELVEQRLPGRAESRSRADTESYI
jgi:uncharacterized protein YggU (UPF0235/DUF167 family)